MTLDIMRPSNASRRVNASLCRRHQAGCVRIRTKRKSRRYTVGVDDGGTKIATGVLDRSLNILSSYVTKEHSRRFPVQGFGTIEYSYPAVLKRSPKYSDALDVVDGMLVHAYGSYIVLNELKRLHNTRLDRGRAGRTYCAGTSSTFQTSRININSSGTGWTQDVSSARRGCKAFREERRPKPNSNVQSRCETANARDIPRLLSRSETEHVSVCQRDGPPQIDNNAAHIFQRPIVARTFSTPQAF